MRYFSKQRLGKDLSSGLTTALVTIPDALASVVLAGLNPVHGLYAVMIGTPVVALAMSSQLMYVANTGVLVERTRLRHFSMILAVLTTSLAVYGFGLDSVRIVADLADIPDSLPLPALPRFGLVMELLPSAAAIALIGLVQSAGVSRSIPNPDGNFPNVSRDFTGQGIANLVASLFKGMPTSIAIP